MPIVNGYATLAELKARLNITDTREDVILEAVITAASRAIEGETGRVFYATQATRHFTAEFHDLLFIDDLLELTALKTDADGDRAYETVWADTDYDLEPFNETPKTVIRIAPNGHHSFPTVRKSVAITGSWGYAATAPAAVNEACLIQAARLFKRKDAPFGVFGTAETGIARLPKLDQDVRLLLLPFVRIEVG